MSKILSHMVLLPMVASVAFANQAYAQRTTTTQIEEIVVTAQKREENIQDVPISISAIDAKTIERTFARSIDEITGMSPNLVINPVLGNGTAAISIRGMQFAEVEKSFDPAVAVYQDGIYLSSTTGALLNVWDAERVEVLRGPQGTLFGRNTVGGLIHVIRSKPTGELGGKIVATIAEDDQEDFKGRINLPEFAGISVKLSALSSEGGGYVDNPIRGETLGDNDLKMYSVDVLWQPTDDFDLRIIYDQITDDTDTRPVKCFTQQNEAFFPFGGDECGADKTDDLFTTFTSFDQYAELHTDAITIHANWSISDQHKLAFVYGKRESEEEALNEFDGTAFNTFYTERPTDENQESFELRLESDWSDSFRTTVGVFSWESDYELLQATRVLEVFTGPISPASYSVSPNYNQEVESISFFAQAEWDITENITVSAGGRYIDEEKSACMANSAHTFDGTNVTHTDSLGFDKTALTAFGDQGLCPGWAADVFEPGTQGKESWTQFTPRVGAQYNFDWGMAYVNYSEGFRSGGFGGRATAPDNFGPYDPEEVEQWEVGVKSTLLDNTLQLNVTLFSIDYNDKQEDIVKPGTDGQATLTVVQNASTASIEGLEMDFTWIVAAGFSLRGNIGLLDAEFDSYLVESATGMVDLSGLDLRRAPEMTAGLGALWEHELSNGGFIIANLNYTWKDDYYISATANLDHSPAGYTDNPSKVDSFGIVDASINYETEHWTFSVFGKNLTDEEYLMSFLDVGANGVATSATDSTAVYAPGAWSFGTPNRPRYFGAEVQYKF